MSQHSEAEDQQVQGVESSEEAAAEQQSPAEAASHEEASGEATPGDAALFLDVGDSEGELVEIEAPESAATTAALESELATFKLALAQAQAELAASREAQGAAERERDELKNRLLRSAADLDNYRKRVQREKEETQRYGASRVVLELLPAVDNMERALEHADKSTDVSTIVDGIRMVQRQLASALEKHGVTSFDSRGERFDPQRHEAIQQVETSEHETGVVLQEFQRGYFLHDRLIRPALVVVARHVPAAAPAEPAGDVIDVGGEAPADAAPAGGGEQEW